MSYTVKVTIDSVETDITDYVIRGSISRDFILHKDLKPTTSTAGFKVLGSYRTLLDSLLLSKAEVPCTILKDSSAYFKGIISPKYSMKAIHAKAEQVSIQVEDFNVSRLKRKIDSNVKLTGYYISDPATPGQSIIHTLAGLAGVEVDSASSPSILVQVPIYVALSDDEKKYEDELTNLLYSYGFVYYFNEAGKLAFYYFGDYDTSTMTAGFKNVEGDAGSNCLEAIKVEKSRETYDKIKLKWYELELKADQVLFEDSTDGDAEGCNIELDSGEYYPEGSGEANVYSEYDLEGLVGAVEAALQATYDSGISISTAFANYGKKALFALQSSADNQFITKLRIVGDAYVQKSKNFTIETINKDVQNILDYESLYIFDRTNAEAFGLILHNYYQYSDFNYLIKSKSAFALGAYVKIEDDIHLSFTAYGRIREIKEDAEGVFSYYIEGVTEYIAEGDSSTVKNQSPTTLANKVAQVIGGIGLLPPDNNVTDVVFEEAQNADGSIRVTATWNYVQGTNKADAAFIYYKGSIVGAPGAFDYALDSAASKPMDGDGEYSWSGNFPGRTGGSGGAPIRYRFGVVAARFSLLHSAGATTPTGWDDKTLVPVIQDIDFNLYDKSFTSYEGAGVFRRAVRVNGNRVAWLNAPEGGSEEEIYRITRAGNGNLLFDSSYGYDFMKKIPEKWEGETVITSASSFFTTSIQMQNGDIRLAYVRESDNFLVERVKSGGSWGSESIIDSDAPYYPCYILRSNGELRIAYTEATVASLVERVWQGSSWGSKTEIEGAPSIWPAYVETASGELRVAYRRASDDKVVERTWNGYSWGSATAISAGDAIYPAYIKLPSGELRIAYRRDSDYYLVERIWTGSAWGSESVINPSSSAHPGYVFTADNRLRIAYINGSGYLVERIWTGSSWGSELIINNYVTGYPDYTLLSDGGLLIVYRQGDSGAACSRYLNRYSPFATESLPRPRAWVKYNATVAANKTGTYVRSGAVVTVTCTGHGLSVGNMIRLDFTSGAATDGNFLVSSVADANTFTVIHGTSGSTSGNVTLLMIAIVDSFGVSCISASGVTGQHFINFGTSMGTNHYTLVGSSSPHPTSGTGPLIFGPFAQSGLDYYSDMYIEVRTMAYNGTNYDGYYVSAVIIR